MKLEAGKEYRTRGGKFVVKCLAVWTEEFDGFQATCILDGDTSNYRLDGHWLSDSSKNDFDIIAEYVEPIRVADYFIPVNITNAYCQQLALWDKRTCPVDRQPVGSVLIPGTEREEESK